MRQRITIRLNEDLLKQAKNVALARGYSLNSLILEGVQIMLGDEPTVDKPKRVPNG